MKFLSIFSSVALGAPVTQIIGGHDATDGMFPHQVTIKDRRGNHVCGGSLLKANVVMSAAHCKQTYNDGQIGSGGIKLSSQPQIQVIKQTN